MLQYVKNAKVKKPGSASTAQMAAVTGEGWNPGPMAVFAAGMLPCSRWPCLPGEEHACSVDLTA